MISLISKNEAIKLLQNTDLTEKGGTLPKKLENYGLKIQRFLKACIKMEKVRKFGNIEIQKQKFYKHNEPTLVKI